MKHVSRSGRHALGPLLSTAVLTLLIAGCTSTSMDDNDYDDMPTNTSSSAPAMMENTPSSPSAMMDKGEYKNGTYSAEGSYQSPAGLEKISVSLTLANGVVTDATFAGESESPKSKNFQAKFASGFKEQVVGKSIDSISLNVVNGSSLTPKGFMDALSKIEAEAKA